MPTNKQKQDEAALSETVTDAGERLFVIINRILIVLIVTVCAYTMLLPLMPNAVFYSKKLAGINIKVPTQVINTQPAGNRIYIQNIGVNAEIHEGTTLAALHNGTWRRPNTSTPDKPGNTVIVGHRFTYSGTDIFYNLDKVKPGDTITLWWNKNRHDYVVATTKVVAPSDVSVEAQTDTKQLTLYTCTPLWTSKARLVIIAKPINGGQQ